MELAITELIPGAFSPAGGAALSRSGAETFDAEFRDRAAGAEIFIGSTFACRAFTWACCELFCLLLAARVVKSCVAPGAPGFLSAGFFGAELFCVELFCADLFVAVLFACCVVSTCGPDVIAGAGCGLEGVTLGAAGFPAVFGVTLAALAPETLSAVFPGTFADAFPEIPVLALPPCVFAYQKYDPPPAAIMTAAAAARIIVFFPDRLRSAALAESN